MLAVNKPVNMPVQEDASGDLDLLNALKDFIKIRDEKPGNVYLALLHRLDRPTSGAMIFAKTSKAASRLSDQFRKNEIKKTYYAVVRSTNLKSKDTLIDYLYKNRDKNQSYVVDKNHDKAKKAILDYEVLDTQNDLSLVKINLITGRPHQIRVQFSNINAPLYGDQKYASKLNKTGQQLALFSKDITFSHPTKKAPITVEASVPSENPWSLFTN